MFFLESGASVIVSVVLQVIAERFSRAKVTLISLQPNQAFHSHLIKRIVIPPLSWSVMANLRTAISASLGVIVTAPTIHHRPIAFPQAAGRVDNHHFRARGWDNQTGCKSVRCTLCHWCMLLGPRFSYFPFGSIHVTRSRK